MLTQGTIVHGTRLKVDLPFGEERIIAPWPEWAEQLYEPRKMGFSKSWAGACLSRNIHIAVLKKIQRFMQVTAPTMGHRGHSKPSASLDSAVLMFAQNILYPYSPTKQSITTMPTKPYFSVPHLQGSWTSLEKVTPSLPCHFYWQIWMKSVQYQE